jgi:hypothetical protein
VAAVTPLLRAGAVAVAVVLLAACSGTSDIRRFLADTYELQRTDGDTLTYSSDEPVGTTVTRIVRREQPAARQADGGSEYLRYDDDIVVVSAAPGGSIVRVEDLDDGYRSGAFIFLGPGFTPGSPAGAGGGGGPGDVK